MFLFIKLNKIIICSTIFVGNKRNKIIAKANNILILIKISLKNNFLLILGFNIHLVKNLIEIF